MPILIRSVALLAMLWLAAAHAQTTTQVPLPLGTATFVDPDPAARIYFSGTDTERGRARLQRHLEKRSNDSRGWAARAYRAAIESRAVRAMTDLERARTLAGSSPRRQREVLWSEGWIHLNLGRPAEAAGAWTQSMQLHGGKPYWVPYSFAVLAELAGERDVALAWYGLAAHSNPAIWGTRRGMQQRSRHWRRSERDAISRVYDAWASQP